MNPLTTLLATAATALGITILAVTPLPELAFILQGSGAGALVGGLVAYRARSRHRAVDPDRRDQIVIRWTLAGTAFSTTITIASGLGIL